MKKWRPRTSVSRSSCRRTGRRRAAYGTTAQLGSAQGAECAMADPAEEYCCDWRAATARRTTRARRSQPRGRSAGSPPATGVGAIAPWDDCADGSAEGAHQATARCLLSVTRRVYGTAPGGRRDDARRCRRPVVRHRCPRSCSHTWSGKMRRIFREHLAIGASHLIRDISYSSTILFGVGALPSTICLGSLGHATEMLADSLEPSS